jgi:hypothetical protein
VVVPTSVMLNWEMEFKKWCVGNEKHSESFYVCACCVAAGAAEQNAAIFLTYIMLCGSGGNITECLQINLFTCLAAN